MSGPALPTRPYLDFAAADRVAGAARAVALARHAAVTIAVVDAGGHLLRLDRLDGAVLLSLRTAEGKARAAVDMAIPSGEAMNVALAVPPLLSIPGLVALAGGVPLFADGVLVGAVGVSGIDADGDVAIAQAGAGAL